MDECVHFAENNNKEQYSVDKKVPEIRRMSGSIERKGSESRLSFKSKPIKVGKKMSQQSQRRITETCLAIKAKSQVINKASCVRDILLVILVPIAANVIFCLPNLCSPWDDDACRRTAEQRIKMYFCLSIIATTAYLSFGIFADMTIMQVHFNKSFAKIDIFLIIFSTWILMIGIIEILYIFPFIVPFTYPILVVALYMGGYPTCLWILYFKYYKTADDEQKPYIFRAIIYTCLINNTCTVIIVFYIFYCAGYFHLANNSAVYVFYFYSIFGLSILRELSMYVLQILYEQLDISWLPLGQTWVFFTHAIMLSFLRGGSIESFAKVLSLSICDICMIVYSVLSVTYGSDPITIIKNIWTGTTVDLSTDRIYKLVMYLVLEEVAECIVPIAFTATTVIIYNLPMGEYIAGVGMTQFGSEKIESLENFVVAMLIIVIVEIFSMALVVAFLKRHEISLLGAVTNYFNQYAVPCITFSITIFTINTVVHYTPFGADFTFRFDWIE